MSFDFAHAIGADLTAYPRLRSLWYDFIFCSPQWQEGRGDEGYHRRQRIIDFRKLLDTLDDANLGDLEVHMILENYGKHKTSLIRPWLAKRSRSHLHSAFPGASWINLMDRWFATLTEKRLPRGVIEHPRF